MKRGVLGVCVAALAAWGLPASAQLSNDSVKIGVATDLSSLYADINGPGAIVATEMAIADFGGTVLGKKIEMVSGDIQNKADVAASLAARWDDTERGDVILGARRPGRTRRRWRESSAPAPRRRRSPSWASPSKRSASTWRPTPPRPTSPAS